MHTSKVWGNLPWGRTDVKTLILQVVLAYGAEGNKQLQIPGQVRV